MTSQEQNIAIAEACGWTVENDKDGGWRACDSDGGFTKWQTEANARNIGWPSYTADLNAMHEAEKTLGDKGELVRQCYLDNLCIASNGESAEMDGSYKEVWAMCYATSQQRAEAFLRTLGKWTN